MLEHLVQVEPEVTIRDGFVELDDASPGDILSAQSNTVDWMAELGIKPDSEVDIHAQTAAARDAFKGLTTVSSDEETRIKLLTLKTPAAVRHITGMLAAYDWEFIHMAKELRGYTVAKLVEETASPNANIRLKALGLLGKVTEVGLFTDKIEIKKTDLTDAEIDQKLKDKLNKFLNVTDVDAVDVEEIAELPEQPMFSSPADEA